MASISTDSGGKRRIMFVAPDGNRRQIRLGKMPMKAVQTIKARVENLLVAALAGNAIDGDESGAKSGALSGDSAESGALPTPADPDLAMIVNRWATLPEAVRESIVAMAGRPE